MGLDMYLLATKYVSGWEHRRDPEFARLVEMFGVTPPGNSPSFNVSATVGYWRKANAIHKWFVDNVQDGKDDCGDYDVSREDLIRLRDACRKVLGSVVTEPGRVDTGSTYYPDGRTEHHHEAGEVVTNTEAAKAILPTTSGFFFGGTDYDKFYLDNLRKTADLIDGLLSNPALEGWDFQYHSSW